MNFSFDFTHRDEALDTDVLFMPVEIEASYCRELGLSIDDVCVDGKSLFRSTDPLTKALASAIANAAEADEDFRQRVIEEEFEAAWDRVTDPFQYGSRPDENERYRAEMQDAGRGRLLR